MQKFKKLIFYLVITLITTNTCIYAQIANPSIGSKNSYTIIQGHLFNKGYVFLPNRGNLAAYTETKLRGGILIGIDDSTNLPAVLPMYWNGIVYQRLATFDDLPSYGVDTIYTRNDSLFYGAGSLEFFIKALTWWDKFGNTGTSAGTNFLGTTDSVDLVFKTNNTERLRMPAVGIGSSTSSTDSVLVRKADLTIGVIAKSALVTATPTWQQTLTAGSVLTGMNSVTVGDALNIGGADVQLKVDEANGIVSLGDINGSSQDNWIKLSVLGTTGKEAIEMTADSIFITSTKTIFNGGNVGIGTSTPDSLLTVELGIRGKRGVMFDGLPTFADTTNYKPVVINSSGTLYKATYWPGGGSGGWGTTGTVATLTGTSTLAMATNSFDFSNGKTIFSTSGGASTPSISITGNPYTAGTATTNHPLHYMNGGTAPTTWSTAGTYAGINAVSGFTGNFLDYHVNGGVSVAKVDYQGTATHYGVTIGKYGGAYGITAPGDFYFAATGGTLLSFLQGSQGFTMTTNAGVTTGMNVIYGGNTGYVKMGSNLSIYGSAGETRFGAAGTENLITLLSSGNTGIGVAAPTSILHTKSFATAYVAKSADYTATISDYTIEVTANSPTITLPTAVGITGRIYFITNSGAGSVTLATTSSQVFRNVVTTPTTLTVATLGGVTVQSNGADWLKISSF